VRGIDRDSRLLEPVEQPRELAVGRHGIEARAVPERHPERPAAGVRQDGLEVGEQAPVDLRRGLGDGDEAFLVVPIDADHDSLELLEAHQAHQLLLCRDGEVREEVVALHLGMGIQEGEFLERMLVHEHVAGARREMEALEAEADRLLDAVRERVVRHVQLRALLLLVGAKPAFQVAGARGLVVEGAGVLGYELPPEPPVRLDLEPDEEVAQLLFQDA
jgi:hypothetical protein